MTSTLAEDTILSVRDLKTWFKGRRLTAKAVDGVTFDLKRGKTVDIYNNDWLSRLMST